MGRHKADIGMGIEDAMKCDKGMRDECCRTTRYNEIYANSAAITFEGTWLFESKYGKRVYRGALLEFGRLCHKNGYYLGTWFEEEFKRRVLTEVVEGLSVRYTTIAIKQIGNKLLSECMPSI